MVTTMEVENFAIKKILVGQDSSVYILYWKTYKKSELLEEAMTPYEEPI